MEGIADLISKKRKGIGMSRSEFAEFLDLKRDGERVVGEWEEGRGRPSDSKMEEIMSLADSAPFRRKEGGSKFKFIDLFAGIGGIRLPFQELGGECAFTSEWDRFSKKTYAANFGEMPSGDITKISAASIPDHDVLLGGFPCQAFSQAGLKKGFCETRGTMFFEIQRILAEKRPKAFLLENVKQLIGHDKGRTLGTILDILEGRGGDVPADVPMSDDARAALSSKLNYKVFKKVLRAADFGIPQNRERVFIVGFDMDYFGSDVDFETLFEWPEPPLTQTRLGDVLEDSESLGGRYDLSERLWEGHKRRKAEHKEKGNGFGYSLFNEDSPYANTLSARYYKDGSEILIDQSGIGRRPRRLTPRECARLQGFPEEFVIDTVSEAQAYKQFGNSVCVSVIRALAEKLTNALEAAERLRLENVSTPSVSSLRKK